MKSFSTVCSFFPEKKYMSSSILDFIVNFFSFTQNENFEIFIKVPVN